MNHAAVQILLQIIQFIALLIILASGWKVSYYMYCLGVYDQSLATLKAVEDAKLNKANVGDSVVESLIDPEKEHWWEQLGFVFHRTLNHRRS